MPDIHVVHPHALGVDAVRARLGGFSDLLAKYGVRMEWTGSRARFVGLPGVGGELDVSASDVKVHVTVSRMITMMGLDPHKLEKTIKRRLHEALSA